MFQSSQHLSYPQQIISLARAYPCPRCPAGRIEASEMCETLECTECKRSYVALHGGHYLFPSHNAGWKVMPIFWWDGFHWHRSGNTATRLQLSWMASSSLIPAIALNLAIALHLWGLHATWNQSALVDVAAALVCFQIIWLLSWDFDFLSSSAEH